MDELTLINPVEQKNWNNLLLNTPGCSFFCTAGWADVLIRSYNYQPFYFCQKKKNGLDCLLPILEVTSPFTGKRGVCLPFTDFCDPLAVNSDQFQELIGRAIELGRKRKWRYLEIRGGEKYLAEEKPSQVFLGHELNLSRGPQLLLSGLRNSTRRNIKKAQNEKVEVHISNSPNALKEFCRLNILTRREHGLPPQPDRFFQNLYNLVIAQNMGFLATASASGQIVAANVYLHFDKEVIYKYGASDRQYQYLRANNLVMWEAIKWSSNKGFQRMVFGRTEPEHQGLMQFKAGWGAKTYRICYYKYDLKQNAFISESGTIHPVMNNIFSKLPPLALRTLGRILYRHMG